VAVKLLQDQIEERLPPEVEASIYRIFQEGLTNIARHAHATLVRVYLQRLPATILMTIEDNGVGFDLAETKGRGNSGGLGLIGIRERVANLHGTLRLESAIGKGTRLTIECPVRFAKSATEAPADAPAADGTASNIGLVRG